MEGNDQNIAVFDLCDTLYYSNTTHDFIDYFLTNKGTRIKKASAQAITGRFSPLKYIGILISVLTGNDLPRRLKLLLLRGYSELELDEMAEGFVRDYLEFRTVIETRSVMEEAFRDRMRVIIVSASIEPVVRAVARRLSISDYLCSTLAFKNGIFSGRLSNDITGRKLTELKNVEPNSQIELVVSDNTSDLDLLGAARRGLAVVHSKRKREFWKNHRIETIEIGI